MLDVEILREALKLARRLGQAAPLTDTVGAETVPGATVQTDEEWETWLRGQVFTEYHPSSTCAMLPRELGGVVDANLRVYGLANVRVADASVPPFLFSAHLMSSTYGLAEQASTIIRRFYNMKAPTSTHSNSTHNSTSSNGSKGSASQSSSSPKHTSSSKDNGAAPASPSHPWAIVLALVAACIASSLTFPF